MSKYEKSEPVVVEKEDDDNVVVDDESSEEVPLWSEVSANASQRVQNTVQTTSNETSDIRGRLTVPVRGGRGGLRGRGRGAHTGGRLQESLQTVIDSQNKIIAKLNATVEEQSRALEKFRVNYAAFQTDFFDVKQERDNLLAKEEARALQKQARLTQKSREVVQKAPVDKK